MTERQYVYDRELDRFFDAKTRASTVTHRAGDFLIKFDIRVDASRFMIVRKGGEVVARGLIEGHTPDGPIAIYDDPKPALIEMPSLELTMLVLFARMQQRCQFAWDDAHEEERHDD